MQHQVPTTALKALSVLYLTSGFLLGISGRGGKCGVLPGVGGIRTSVLLTGGSGGPPLENVGISGAQRALFTPSEASLQINYQIPRGDKQYSRGGKCPPP